MLPLTTLYLGNELDGPILFPLSDSINTLFLGPNKLLKWLEETLGLDGFSQKNDYLRVELYRQALLQYLEANPNAFFARSFESDRFATASALLHYRDQLCLAGWDFTPMDTLPDRLRVWASVEFIFQQKAKDPHNFLALIGEADRWNLVIKALQNQPIQLEKIILTEPKTLFPSQLKRCIRVFEDQGTLIETLQLIPQAPSENARLAAFQQYLLNQPASPPERTDQNPEIILLSSRSDTDAATFIAQTLRRNPHWQPGFLLPELDQSLELAFVKEGVPPFGILSATLARPALQVLKLAPAFLWEPLDIFKIMEFVTLPVKPLERGLSLEIAKVLAARPGLFSDAWFSAVLTYLEEENPDPAARAEYQFWFQRRQYPIDGTAPKKEAINLYAYLENWANALLEQSANRDNTFRSLSEQARKIRELLETVPEPGITFLELERIVRTIVEPSPTQFAETATGHYGYTHQPGAFLGPVHELIWWNCLFENNSPDPDFWHSEERQWLSANGVQPDHPNTTAQRRLLSRIRPILQTQQRLWLVLPEYVHGEKAVHHLIVADLKTFFKKEQITHIHLDKPADRQQLQQLLRIPSHQAIEVKTKHEKEPILQIPKVEAPEQLQQSPTGLESLFYYPHHWYLRQFTGIYPANLLTVNKDQTLLGNLAHRFFELLLSESTYPQMNKEELESWIERSALDLFRKEGATLLLYGREPERKAFLRKIKFAAWNLTSMIRNNGWKVEATELALHGVFEGTPIKGKADLVLTRENGEKAIVDLKWSGLNRRKQLLQNEEDLQLVLYAYLLETAESWPHTAYFILDSGKMIARNNQAFQEAITVHQPDTNHAEVCQRIFEKMKRTYHWRLEQLKQGLLEIRTQQTSSALEEVYGHLLLDLLEMKKEDKPWDDYHTLIEFG